MELGVHVTDFSWPGEPGSIRPTLDAIAEETEACGASSLSFMDHWFQMEFEAEATEPMLEGYTSLGYLAARTERLKLGLLVTGVTYRHPGLLAKIVTTLDVLSGGRAQLGLGGAWYEREHRALGVPFPPVAERLSRLEETLQICLQMWSDDDGPFDGRYYQLAETICRPRPIARPHPPVLIGGGGERRTLRLVARYADASNLFATSVSDVERKLDVLRAHCAEEGRDYETVTKTVLAVRDPFADTQEFLAEMARLAGLGVAEVMVMPKGDPVAYIRRVGKELVPALSDLSTH